MIATDHFSLLSNARVRPLPIALAQEIFVAKPGTERMEILNRLFLGMIPADRMKCQVELHRCRQAKRGQIEAQVT